LSEALVTPKKRQRTPLDSRVPGWKPLV